MKKHKKTTRLTAITTQNPVAKFAYTINKSICFRDKTKYLRNAKHRKQEASLLALAKTNNEASCFKCVPNSYNWLFNALSLNACQ